MICLLINCCSPSVWLVVEVAAEPLLLDGELDSKLDIGFVGFVGGLFVLGVARWLLAIAAAAGYAADIQISIRW